MSAAISGAGGANPRMSLRSCGLRRLPPRALHDLAPCIACGIEALPGDLDHGDDRLAVLLVAGDHAVAHDEQRVQKVAGLRQRRVDIGALGDDLAQYGFGGTRTLSPPTRSWHGETPANPAS